MMRTWIDQAAYAAMQRYLRTCSAGGMPQELVEAIDLHVDAAADLGMFSGSFVVAMNAQGKRLVDE
jgi:hypothetical protein